MKQSKFRKLCTGLILFGIGAVAQPAAAITYDHLQCLKIKDAASFSAIIDMRPTALSSFSVNADCTVKSHSRQLCIPVSRYLEESSGPLLNVSGQDLTNAFLCYKVKCPAANVPVSLEMSDQFTTRTLTGFRIETVCVPALEGTPPPTTTTTLPPGTPRSCVNATPPNCDGTCNDYNRACAPDNGACICLYVDVWGGCPMIGGDVSAGCHGSCEGSQTCIEVSGACQCGFAIE